MEPLETLNETEWDVVIAGTGIQQSLLALALSRSEKRILHVDKNDYYGGAEAALSLQEAESWVQSVQKDNSTVLFTDAKIEQAPNVDEEDGPKLGFSRAYSLALAPQLIYTESKLLGHLVSSKVYRQLEFLAMGNWWVYTTDTSTTNSLQSTSEQEHKNGKLVKVPTTREDVVFSDKSVDLRSKRAVMKVLRFLMDYEQQTELWEPYSMQPLPTFLTEKFKLPTSLHNLFLALTLSPDTPANTTTAYALSRIARHLRSTGRLGAGFSSVIPKWGGLSELAQVSCRAGAVGGAVYVLGKGIAGSPTPAPTKENVSTPLNAIQLDGGDAVNTAWIVGSEADLPRSPTNLSPTRTCSRSISIISGPLTSLIHEALAEGATPSTTPIGGTVIVFPSGSLNGFADTPPVYLIVHSDAMGECPRGQSVIYASTSGKQEINALAVDCLLRQVAAEPVPKVLWTMQYEQHAGSWQEDEAVEHEGVITMKPSSLDLVFDENILSEVESAWKKVLGDDAGTFLTFEDRNSVGDDDDGDEA
ncbi:hypothetical protein EJ08DRAFT_627082 [Tothia fuscella]|uniref:Rab proteins geranylgeranyltransferase n=1 Tax=Tothia fuscella TaxID=1048955 RepID=A0A9P4P075_9PEZI|nr:hypothetical protein EJ08DRAFT_627082 [Tothia fuscella]